MLRSEVRHNSCSLSLTKPLEGNKATITHDKHSQFTYKLKWCWLGRAKVHKSLLLKPEWKQGWFRYIVLREDSLRKFPRFGLCPLSRCLEISTLARTLASVDRIVGCRDYLHDEKRHDRNIFSHQHRGKGKKQPCVRKCEENIWK